MNRFLSKPLKLAELAAALRAEGSMLSGTRDS
jgi:hypothetical protein